MFKAELFDPDHWADVFKKSGAKCKEKSINTLYKYEMNYECQLTESIKKCINE